MYNTYNSRYSLVTPVRNEERVLDKTIRSVLTQTIRPHEWVILDDGSTDGTRRILRTYSEEYSWIKTVFTQKKASTYWGVQEKLRIAFDLVHMDQIDFIGKLDADIILGPTYFEDLMERFYQDPRLGIAGGTLYYYKDGKKVLEKCPSEHVRGGLKFYRIECWNDIGGMEFKMGYDTIDEIKASMLGWRTMSFEDIKALHLRPTGKRMGLKWFYSLGKDHYVSGYDPLFLILKCAKDMAYKPYIVGGILKFAGFVMAWFTREKTIDDRAYLRFLRSKQRKRLFSWRR